MDRHIPEHSAGRLARCRLGGLQHFLEGMRCDISFYWVGIEKLSHNSQVSGFFNFCIERKEGREDVVVCGRGQNLRKKRGRERGIIEGGLTRFYGIFPYRHSPSIL